MPIIKSSRAGGDITVVIFTDEEVTALVNLLESVRFDYDDDTVNSSIDILEELVYGLGINVKPL
jgi:hypothetical protein